MKIPRFTVLCTSAGIYRQSLCLKSKVLFANSKIGDFTEIRIPQKTLRIFIKKIPLFSRHSLVLHEQKFYCLHTVTSLFLYAASVSPINLFHYHRYQEPCVYKKCFSQGKVNSFPYKTTICCIPSVIHQNNLSYEVILPLRFSISFAMEWYQTEHQLKMCLLDFRG